MTKSAVAFSCLIRHGLRIGRQIRGCLSECIVIFVLRVLMEMPENGIANCKSKQTTTVLIVACDDLLHFMTP